MLMNDQVTESDLIIAAKENPKNFEVLYVKYYSSILKFSYKRLESLDDAYEITSKTFTNALINIKQYQHKGFMFSTWLFQIAINEINQFYRQNNKRRTISIDDKISLNLITETGIEKQDLNQSLHKALQYLNLAELHLIELRFFEERPFSEVAQILGITENNAKVKTYRVLDKLRIVFKQVS